jgi:hypothetical protein
MFTWIAQYVSEPDKEKSGDIPVAEDSAGTGK